MSRLSPATVGVLETANLDPTDLAAVVERAMAEDLGGLGDLTSRATVSPGTRIHAKYAARQPGTLAGLVTLLVVADLCLGDGVLDLRCHDGERVVAGQTLAVVESDARMLLAAERTSLNLLGHLSGIATVTAAWVAAVAGTGARIRDTRKTTPGLRDLEKYAVRCGGGVNHRRGLDGGVLIKDNHVAAAGGIAAALRRVQAEGTPAGLEMQVEVDDLNQLGEAIESGATSILLDNFSLEDTREAVRRTRDTGVTLEASGGLTLERAPVVAATGVDFLAVGGLTHSAPSLDIGLDVLTE